MRAQYLLTLRTIHKLALPDRFLRATSDDAPETASELKFRPSFAVPADVNTGRRVGLRTALRNPPSATRPPGRSAVGSEDPGTERTRDKG